MNPPKLAEIHTKMLFSRWRSPGMVISACVAAACLVTVPARATGFLNDLSSWSGATACTSSSGCVDSLGSGNYDIGGTDAVGQYIITSPAATIDTLIGFDYSFEPLNPSLASAGYSLDGSTYTLLAVSQTSSIGPLLLTSGNSFSFRLTNSGEQPILGVSNFNSTPVPAPVPALGAVVAFRASRRLRACSLRLRERRSAGGLPLQHPPESMSQKPPQKWQQRED
jgi:hypothetical protein